MSSPTDIQLHPSLAAGFIAALPWAAALITVLALASIGWWQAWLFFPAALAGLVWQVRSSGLLLGQTTITALELRGDELWATLGDSHRYPAKPAPDSRISENLVLLKLSLPTTRYSPKTVILMANSRLPGNVQSEPFRQLRVWLRLRNGSPHA